MGVPFPRGSVEGPDPEGQGAQSGGCSIGTPLNESLSLLGPLSPVLSHQEAGQDDLCVFQILGSETPSPTLGCPWAGMMTLKEYF